MGIQAIAIVEEATRGTDPTTGYQWIPVTGSLFPTFNATDESRAEFRGADSALGNTEDSTVRRESQVTYALECAYYAGPQTGLLFKYLLGKEGTRAVEDTSAYKGPLYPLAQPYGTDNELGVGAVGIMVLYDKEGTTYKRYYGGLRPFDCTFAAEGTDDIKLTFNLKAPGEYVGAEAVNDLTPDYSAVPSPFTSQDLLCYIGAGVSVTGTAPDYTDISAGAMTQFCPDSVNFTLTSGNDDKVQMCGVEGPSKTFRSAQFAGEITIPIDLEDPSTGFSSWDEYDKIFTGPSNNVLLFVMDNGELAGAETSTYESTFYFPAVLAAQETPEFASDGTQPTVSLGYSTLYDSTAASPLIMQTVDKSSAY
jgi:hypothetical protein